MQIPKYTVIVPIYNAAAYLHTCIDSILDQSYSNFELLLVDDGSTDGSLQICSEYAQKDDRIRMFHKANGGEASARNYGLQQARGEYVCWVDADDSVSSDYLADLVRDVEDDIDLVIQSLVRKEDHLERKVRGVAAGSYHLDVHSDQHSFFSSVNLNHFGVSVSKAFRLAIIRRYSLSYSSNIRLAVDLDFLFRYLCHCHHVVVTDHANYYYYIRKGTASTTIYDYQVEVQGLRQISSSCNLLHSCFLVPQVERLQGQTIAAYVHRVLISCYKPKNTRAQRFAFFRSITSSESKIYKQYGPKQTAFLRLMNYLFVSRFYVLFDGLMLWVYRVRYPLL